MRIKPPYTQEQIPSRKKAGSISTVKKKRGRAKQVTIDQTMNLSKNDILEVTVAFVLAGMLGAASSLAVLFTDRKSGGALGVKTKAVHTDRTALACCRELERRVKHVDEVLFLRIVGRVDNIILLRHQLQAKQQDVTPSQAHDYACYNLTCLQAACRDLVIKCDDHKLPPKEIADLETLLSNLVDGSVDKHMKAIAKMSLE